MGGGREVGVCDELVMCGGDRVRRPRSWVKELEVYDGQWLHGLKHGEGRMEFRDGVVWTVF